jgi:PhnB protein
MSSQTNSTLLQPYLFFGGRCQEAIDFYQRALGAEVMMLMRFKEAPDPVPPEMVKRGWDEKIMHSCLRVGGATFMASDGCGDAPAFGGFSLSLTFQTEAEVDRAFAALAEGGQEQMPLDATFWSPRFGMVTDRFGVGWMLMVAGEPTSATAKAQTH